MSRCGFLSRNATIGVFKTSSFGIFIYLFIFLIFLPNLLTKKFFFFKCLSKPSIFVEKFGRDLTNIFAMKIVKLIKASRCKKKDPCHYLHFKD